MYHWPIVKQPLDGRTVKPLIIAPAAGTLINNYSMLRKAHRATINIMGIVAEVQGVRESKKTQSLLKDPGQVWSAAKSLTKS